MSFFQKIKKPSYIFNITYDNQDELYHFKVKVLDESKKCQEKINDEESLLEKCLFEDSSKENPIGAFWHYNSADLPSFLFNS